MNNEGGGQVHGPLIFGRKVGKSRVGIQTEANDWPLQTISGACRPGQVAFHNPCPAGGAQSREQTKTECLHLPVPAMGNKF